MHLCRHCQRLRVSRPRGLCWVCYYVPGVRELYPSSNLFVCRGFADFYGRARLPLFPTQALPGTPEKIAILEQRASQGLELWHPDDARLDQRTLQAG